MISLQILARIKSKTSYKILRLILRNYKWKLGYDPYGEDNSVYINTDLKIVYEDDLLYLLRETAKFKDLVVLL